METTPGDRIYYSSDTFYSFERFVPNRKKSGNMTWNFSFFSKPTLRHSPGGMRMYTKF